LASSLRNFQVWSGVVAPFTASPDVVDVPIVALRNGAVGRGALLTCDSLARGFAFEGAFVTRDATSFQECERECIKDPRTKAWTFGHRSSEKDLGCGREKVLNNLSLKKRFLWNRESF
jgi:hypothetical protein